ncbi:MAG: ABC transporter permease [Verrucomicrobiales bacterium]|nr:ABC transporter permease [Verrucomicrobiales bacterium]
MNDLKFAIRQLLKNPGFTAVAVLTLALGIGANTAIFSVINAVLIRPLPYPNSDRLVQIWQTNPRANRWGAWVSYPDFLDWQEQSTTLEEVGALRPWGFNITGGDRAEALEGGYVSASLFSVLEVKPLMGRTFLPEEDQPGANRVALLSHGLWQRRFAGDPRVIGKSISIDSEPHTVVGVMPPGFSFPNPRKEIWIPHGPPSELKARGSHNFQVVARLKPGVTIEQAQANLDVIARGLADQYPENRDMGAKVSNLKLTAVGEAASALYLLLGAVALVLLIACANVANLLMARNSVRLREIAVRQAVGASRPRLIRQLLTESVLLAFAGGLAGLALAYGGLEVVLKLSPEIPRLQQTAIDTAVLATTLLVSLATGILFGIAPALRTSKVELSDVLRAGTKMTSWRDGAGLRRLLLIAESSLALMLLVGAGLLIRSFLQVGKVNPGFSSERVLTGMIMLPQTKYAEARQQKQFVRQVIDRLQALPGVEAAAASTAVPFFGHDNGGFQVEGRPVEPPATSVILAERPKITPEYFDALKIRLLQGRNFKWTDDENAPPVAIVSEGLVQTYWPSENPIGKRVSIENRDGQPVWRDVVGVVADVKQDSLTQSMHPHIFVPFMQFPRRGMMFAIRTRGSPNALAASLQAAVAEIDQDQPVFWTRSMEDRISESLSNRRFQTLLLAAFAGLALSLAAVGIYGVTAYVVSQRTREIGIRVALGAQTFTIVGLVVRHGMSLTAVGVLIGLGGAIALARLMSAFLFQVEPSDPVTFAMVAILLIAVSLVACWLPAQRASKVHPVEALRCE